MNHHLAFAFTRSLSYGLWALASLGAAFAQTPDLPYTSGSTGADGALNLPAPLSDRWACGAAYDAERAKVVVFGGNSTRGYLAETWIWDGTWTQQNPPTAPSARLNPNMAYDAERKQVMLFGGYGRVGQTTDHLDDTWVWDGQTWTQLSPASSPTPREGAAVAYDAQRKEIVMFGGYVKGVGWTDETWVWDGATWTMRTPGAQPSARYHASMAYDAARQNVVLTGGYPGNDTWLWDGATWTAANPANLPPGRSDTALAYDPVRQEVLMFGGSNSGGSDFWAWNGSNWIQKNPSFTPLGRSGHSLVYDIAKGGALLIGGSYDVEQTSFWNGAKWSVTDGRDYVFDLNAKPDGIWNYTTITIPAGITVTFLKNAANTPVYWLAQGAVKIDGNLNLRGGDGGFYAHRIVSNVPAEGGPGGYAGGLGGAPFNISGSYNGTPGLGPGGGAPGTTESASGASATHASTYGNVYANPLLGGSGGGGGGSNGDNYGGDGGGGGGSILIASSTDTTINGEINVEGGSYAHGGASYSGSGSPGEVRLVADRVLGSGIVRAGGGETRGRIRIEGYFRSFAANNHSTTPSATAPVEGAPIAATGQLLVTGVAGKNVVQPPGGSLSAPDVVFTQAGPISVTVTAQGIPDGSPVKLRIAASGGVIEPTAVNLAGGTATFHATVPAGVGTIQASSTYAAAPAP